MAVTRSSTAAKAMQAFSEGVGSVLRQWTALELALHHQWGGTNGEQNAAALTKEIIDLFSGPDKIYKDDVSLLLEDYMDTKFCTICEDGSPDEIGDLFVTMWRQCAAGDFTLVTNALAREYVRHEMVSRSEGLEAGDADDSSDDEDGAENARKLEAVREGTELAMASHTTRKTKQLSSIEENNNDNNDGTEVEMTVEQPLIVDGWETVARGKKQKKKG